MQPFSLASLEFCYGRSPCKKCEPQKDNDISALGGRLCQQNDAFNAFNFLTDCNCRDIPKEGRNLIIQYGL